MFSLHSSRALTHRSIISLSRAFFLSGLFIVIFAILSSISKKSLENTVILFIGDNGTPKRVITGYKKYQGKGSLYQGGINTPFFVSGKFVKRKNEIDNSLINSTDLFATILELAGTNITQMHDSKSVVHLFSNQSHMHRKYVYSEISSKNYSGFTIRDNKYKYIHYSNKKYGKDNK